MRDLEGIDELRATVNVLNNCREGFNHRFTTEELLTLVRMMWASGWEITPDSWSETQIDYALNNIPPEWNDDETPNHAYPDWHKKVTE